MSLLAHETSALDLNRSIALYQYLLLLLLILHLVRSFLPSEAEYPMSSSWMFLFCKKMTLL